MKWPWVSRLAYDQAIADRDHWRELATRVRRVEVGMPEAPREKAAPPEPVQIPAEILEIIAGFDSPAVQSELKRQVIQSFEQNTPWPEIQRLLERQLA